MSNDIVAVQMSTRFITFHRAQTGFFFRANKTVSFFSYLLLNFDENNIHFYLSGNGWPLQFRILYYQWTFPRVAQEARASQP